MTTLLFGAQWVNLAQSVLLMGAFFLLLLAGWPATDFMRRWEQRVLLSARWFVVAALASGVTVLCTQTALFEGRPEAAKPAAPKDEYTELNVRATGGGQLTPADKNKLNELYQVRLAAAEAATPSAEEE